MVGVATPLHLAASLLAVTAACGLGAALLEARRLDDIGRVSSLRVVAVAGAGLLAAGHVVDGAFLAPPEVGAWLVAGGLAGIALGASPALTSRLASPVVVPLAPLPPSVAGALAGAAAGIRLLTGGTANLPLGLGLLAFGVASGLRTLAPLPSAGATLVASVLVGAWLWQVAARRVLAKLLAAFVVALLALVVLLSALLSTTSGNQLVNEELEQLQRFAEQLSSDVHSWPQDATAATSALLLSPTTLLELQPDDVARAQLVYELAFRDQDWFMVLGPSGQVQAAHPPELTASTRLAIAGSQPVVEVLGGASAQAGGIVTAGARPVALGAVPLRPEGLRPEEPPAGVLVTGRFIDGVWVEQEASRLGVGVIAEIPGAALAVGGHDEEVAQAVLDELGTRRAAALQIAGGTRLAAAAPLVIEGGVGARIVTTATADVLTTLEREQTRELLLSALLGAALAAAVATLVVRRFVRPIRELTEVAERVGRGDLSIQADADTPDEVGRLGRTFNAMTRSLSMQRSQLAAAAAAQARLSARLESLTRSMGEGLIAVDSTGAVIAFNPAAERTVGVSADEVMGKPLEAAVAPRIVDAQAGRHFGNPTDPRVQASRLLLARPGGGLLPIAMTAAPVRDASGTVLGRVYVLRDITREAEVERMKTQFLANVSHELRTPLTPIKGYANVLARREVGSAATKTFAAQILDASERLERIIGMIVDFAGLDSGRTRLRNEPVDLDHVVRETVEQWRSDHADRRFDVALNGGLPRVLADRAMLRRCLDELLDNAVKFSPGGEPVTVGARVEDGRVRLDVRDHGVGLDRDQAARIFTDFYQADGTETRHFGGLGLGLALVRRIVEGMGGAAAVSSTVGEGSTFSVLLPVAPPPTVPAPPP